MIASEHRERLGESEEPSKKSIRGSFLLAGERIHRPQEDAPDLVVEAVLSTLRPTRMERSEDRSSRPERVARSC